MTRRNRLIVVGLGAIGQELLERLSRDIEIVCVDIDPEASARARKLRGEETRVVTGDATSRLVLEEARVDEADCVVITATKENVNLEIARILVEHFRPKRIISIGVSTQGTERLREMGVEVQNIFSTTAAGIRNMIEQRTRTAHAIGLGKNEIMEVEVHPSSRLANKPLHALDPIRWRIGIIYRDGNIIVPRREVVLKPRDRVIILGDPGVLRTVSEILTFSFEKFPLEYGSTAVAYVGGGNYEKYFDELEYVCGAFPLRRIIFLYSEAAVRRVEELDELMSKRKFREPVMKHTVLPIMGAVESAIKEAGSDCGLIVLPAGQHLFGFGGRRLLRQLCTLPKCPVLLTRGTYPYEKVAVPGVADIDMQHVLYTALEISSSLNNEISVLFVRPSEYISSEEERAQFESARKVVSEISLMYRSQVQTPLLRGNPVKAVAAELANFNLLVVDTGSWKGKHRWSGFLSPDVLWQTVKKSPVSTLILPPEEEAL